MRDITSKRNATVEQLRRKEGGFTLVELLVVIVILGILSAVVVFAVGGITDKGKGKACEATANSIQVASEAFRAQSPTNAYAATIAELDPEYVRLGDLSSKLSGGDKILTVDGGVITYNAGEVTDTCVA